MKKFYAIAFAMLFGASLSASAQKSVYFSTSADLDFSKVKETTTTISMSRVLYAGYNTICLPFSVSSDELLQFVGEEVMLEKLAAVNGNNLSFIDVTKDGIEAGLPYLIYSPKTKTVSFKTQDMALLTQPKALTVGGVTMQGLFNTKQEVGLYGIPAKQDVEILESVLVRTEGDKTFLPTRCGISYPACSGIPTIMHVTSLADVTPISKLMADNAKVTIYSVGGQLVQKNVRINDAKSTLTPGVYVVNGQKMIVK